MKKITKLTESDLTRIIKKVINERTINNKELPLCSDYKNFIPQYTSSGLFQIDFDGNGNMHLYCTRDKEMAYLGYKSLPPCVKDQDYCRVCQ